MNNKKPKIAALIVAAGSGTRFGNAAAPKQYAPLLGRPVLRWSVDRLRSRADIAHTCIVIQPEHKSLCQAALSGLDDIQIVDGGATRQESVRRGLEAIAAHAPDFVLIHDAARPCVTDTIIDGVIQALADGESSAIPALPVTDTLKKLGDKGEMTTHSREGLYAVQTPQGFAFGKILAQHQAHAQENLTDDAALFERDGLPVTLVAGNRDNIKITYAEDIDAAAGIISLACGDIRTGKGYDVHRLVPPRDDARQLIIGGIVIPHDKVLDGHSDADVGLHAITDALLGTICDGDIGMHFSPKDMRWKGADSGMFLQHAAQLLAAQGGVLMHADLTIICEAPKIGPHRDAMRTRIAELLHLPINRVSVKATTTEGLGFTGRGEGIAAEAVVTVRLPFAAPIATQTHQQSDDVKIMRIAQ